MPGKRKILLVSALSFCALCAAQISVDPSHEFYADAMGWQLKGLVRELPQTRPYPVNVIRSILEEVSEKGDAREASRAAYYSELLFGKPWKVFAGAGGAAKLSQYESGGGDGCGALRAEAGAAGDAAFSDLFSAGYSAGIYWTSGGDADADTRPKFDPGRPDPACGAFSVDAGDTALGFDVCALGAFGKENVFVTAGLNRTEFGPFPDDNIALSASAYQSLNLTFQYIGSHFGYTQILAALGAEKLSGGDGFSADKYLAFHSLRVPLFGGRIAVSYYESAVWGKGFIPQYVLPMPYAVSAGAGGYYENALAGLLLEWRPAPCMELAANLFVDDMKPKQILKLKPDSGLRVAFQAGFVYTPLDSLCDMLCLDYTLVTPYTYTYFDSRDSSYNYADYTNFGRTLGSSLPPNSDRLRLDLRIRLTDRIRLRTTSTFGRHANACESLDAEEVRDLCGTGAVTDGGVLASDRGFDTATELTNFLNQEHVMYFIQAGFSVECALPRTGAGSLSVTFGYVFEYIRNNGVDTPIYAGLSLGDDDDDDAVQEKVRAAKEEWADSLYDTYNHIFSVGLKYSY